MKFNASNLIKTGVTEFLHAVRAALFRQYAGFSGRVRRRDFWYFIVFLYLLIQAVELPAWWYEIPPEIERYALLAVALPCALPLISVTVRRLHDTDCRAWWLLCFPIPILGSWIPFPAGLAGRIAAIFCGMVFVLSALGVVVVVYYLTHAGDHGPNRFGPPPPRQPRHPQPVDTVDVVDTTNNLDKVETVDAAGKTD
ncbi:MAG: DUF805 domain-containing protein [Methylobacteriaceae bacterium]|jgi:uncharacterized membrane protein YhaH (DUF805 family)|nr:DUF805 domain-containing protein [Methylobacteriaceae bacterium]